MSSDRAESRCATCHLPFYGDPCCLCSALTKGERIAYGDGFKAGMIRRSQENTVLAHHIVGQLQLVHDPQHAWWHTTVPPEQLAHIVAGLLGPLHRDYVKNEWGAGYQQRLERLPAYAPYKGDTSGSYSFTTEPHTDEDCPFKDSETVAMVSVPVEGDYRLPEVDK